MSAGVPALYIIIMAIMFGLMWLEDFIGEQHRHKESMKWKNDDD